MSNIKRVEVFGIAPFNLYENDPLKSMLAFLAGPTAGIKLEWTGSAGFMNNDDGGKTAMYNFQLIGEEAVSWGWIEEFTNSIREIGGSITKDKVFYIEC